MCAVCTAHMENVFSTLCLWTMSKKKITILQKVFCICYFFLKKKTEKWKNSTILTYRLIPNGMTLIIIIEYLCMCVSVRVSVSVLVILEELYVIEHAT